MLKKKYDSIVKQYILSIIIFAYIYKQLNANSFNRPLEMYECIYYSFKSQTLMNTPDLHPVSNEAKLITSIQNAITVLAILYYS